MRQIQILLLLHWLFFFANAEDVDSNKVLEDEPNGEEYERKHRRRRPNNNVGAGYTGPCGFGGYGRTFGDKLFGNPGYSYIVAPVNNYYYTCGVQPVPVPSVPIPPVPIVQPYPSPGFGHHHNHNHGFGNPGVSAGSASFAGPGAPFAPHRPNYNQQYNRPFGNVVSAAASGFGNALADYFSGGSRPRKIYRQFNKQVNQLFKPLTQLL